MNHLTSDRWLVPIAFAVIYIVWGSTYLANLFAIRDIPVFLMCGSRFMLAGALLFGASFLFGASRPTLANWKGTALMGVLFFLIGNGGAVWALQYINSGIAALIIASQPLVTVLLMWKMLGSRPSNRTFFGIAIGLVGMALLVGQDHFITDDGMLAGIVVILISVLAWGYATIRISQLDLPKMKMQGAGMQMLLGGAMLLSVGLVTGEMASFDLARITPRGAWSFVYLVIFGSIIAFSAFNYLLLKITPDKVATSNYVNPVVALLLGWWLNSETITPQSFMAAGLLLVGVVFITLRKRGGKHLLIQRPMAAASPAEELMDDGTLEIDLSPAPSKSGLIARIWHGSAPADRTAEYVDWAKEWVVPEFTAQAGNLGLTLHRRTEGDVSHLTFVSYWQDLEAVKNFIGKDFEKALYFPKEREMLLEYEERVEHREVRV